MKLNVQNRLAILSILPAEGRYSLLKTVESLRDAVRLTDEERSNWSVKETVTPNGELQYSWDKARVGEVEKVLTDPQKAVIVDQLKGLNDRSKLTMNLLDIYRRFGLDKD